MPPSDHGHLRRIVPQPVERTTVDAAYDVPRPAPAGRPWLGVCMVTSLDGSVVVDGGSGGLGNPHDLEILLTLRRLADVVIVGAGTVRGEGYGPPKHPGKRIGVVTDSGNVDLDTDLFTSGAGFVISNRRSDVDETRVEVLRAGDDEVDVVDAVRRIHEIVPNVRYVQAEGGPRFNGSLHDADLIDELDISLSPNVVGGDGRRVVANATEAMRRFDLDHLLADDDGFLFARYLRRRTV